MGGPLCFNTGAKVFCLAMHFTCCAGKVFTHAKNTMEIVPNPEAAMDNIPLFFDRCICSNSRDKVLNKQEL